MPTTTCTRCHSEILWGSLSTGADIAAGTCTVPCELRAPPSPAPAPTPPDVTPVLIAAEHVEIRDVWVQAENGSAHIVAATEAGAVQLARAAKRVGLAAVRTMTAVRVTHRPGYARTAVTQP